MNPANLKKEFPNRVEDANSKKLVMSGCSTLVTGFRNLKMSTVIALVWSLEDTIWPIVKKGDGKQPDE